MENSLVYLLSNTDSITDLISDRVFPLVVPKCAKGNAIVYQVISETKGRLYQGICRYRKARVQIDCWAESLTSANDLGDAVEELLDEYRGTVEGLKISSIAKLNRFPKLDESTGKFASTIEFYINYIK